MSISDQDWVEDFHECSRLIEKQIYLLPSFKGHSKDNTSEEKSDFSKPSFQCSPGSQKAYSFFPSLISFAVAKAVLELHEYQLDPTEDKPTLVRNDFVGGDFHAPPQDILYLKHRRMFNIRHITLIY